MALVQCLGTAAARVHQAGRGASEGTFQVLGASSEPWIRYSLADLEEIARLRALDSIHSLLGLGCQRAKRLDLLKHQFLDRVAELQLRGDVQIF